MGDGAALSRDPNLQLQNAPCRLERLRALMEILELRVRDRESVIERIEAQHRRARPRFDLRIVRTERRDVMGRIRAAERRCRHDCRCKGDKRQKPPPRRVCLPKHEGRTVPQFRRRKPRPGVESGMFAQVAD